MRDERYLKMQENISLASKNVKSPLLELGVFTTPAFKIFKEQMEAALDTKDVALPVDMHPNVKHVLQNQQQLIVRQGEIMSRVPGNLESMSYASDYALRIESKLDYLINRIGPHGSWQPCASPIYGYYPYPVPQAAFQHQYESRSTEGSSYPPRGPAPVSMTALAPPRWTPVSHQQPLLQEATQTTTTTETTTTTTATTATTTTSLVIGSLKVNYRLQDVADICAEVQQYDQELQKAGKKKVPMLERKHQKQVSNKRTHHQDSTPQQPNGIFSQSRSSRTCPALGNALEQS
ncbi:hypothetical protein KVV02_005212 [Mortierella alpina]|uniref:Uncharacterized protein n=1 Tax=Mortierella alpina TaxID=64518 RepID=A0A9P8CW04_MORAP|nr:hypothetical protein KVV02_005212 [Mortierella alpina]